MNWCLQNNNLSNKRITTRTTVFSWIFYLESNKNLSIPKTRDECKGNITFTKKEDKERANNMLSNLAEQIYFVNKVRFLNYKKELMYIILVTVLISI